MKKQNGITLIALVISIIVMLILAGVSINAIVGENGVLTKAQNAKLASEESARLEELELILFEYNSSEFLGESDGFAAFLADKKADGTIQDYIYLDNLIIKYKDKYYEAESDGEYYSISGRMEDNLTGGGLSNDYIITPDNLTNNMEFQAGSSYVVLDKVSGEDFNFEIPAGDPVTIKLVGDMTIDNKGYKRSAIDLAEGATLNLHIYGNVEVNSGYGEDGFENTPGKGGYAGIHVPEGATLNLYGTGEIKAIGGNAGNGATFASSSNIGGAGGGGAGAGIGGHGGSGGAGVAGASESGKNGENCGNINIYNSISIYAYGGAGGSGGAGTADGAVDGVAGAGGGYPAAGIGGGGAGGAGASCCSGGGGFSGGSAENAIFSAQNGLAGAVGTDPSVGALYSCPGGGYLGGPEGEDLNGINKAEAMLGGLGGIGNGLSHLAGCGGIAGAGGTVKVSSEAKVYAYNGNRYTDGTSYENGLNQCPIYAQNGIKLAKYNHLEQSNYVYVNLELEYEQSTISTLSYKNPLIDEKNQKLTIDSNISYLSNIDMSRQGIGSGAGYIETSNGTYTIDSSMN